MPAHQTRRWFIQSSSLLFTSVLLSLTACEKLENTPQFNSIDISGAPYGKDFRFQDTEGQWRMLADYRGKTVLLFFGFTQCPDVCPTALARAAAVHQLLGKKAKNLQVLFATLDPERDTPAIIKAYVKGFDPSFIGLRTSVEDTKTQASNFKVFYEKVALKDSAIGYTIDHTALSYVFDPNGQLRLAVRDSLTAQQLAQDIQLLLEGK
ncbi:MAG: SCO family protein [Burkholderiaceae bacterium]|nr:SCO family protein [Burkholderiaceae bacterium]